MNKSKHPISLKAATKGHYDKFELSTEQLARLQEITDSIAEGEEQAKAQTQLEPQVKGGRWISANWIKRWAPWALAASILLVAMLQWNQYQRQLVIDNIVQEVVTNHISNKPLDIVAGNYSQANQSLSGLDFRLIDAQGFEQEGMTMLGVRYCSVQSVPAALVRHQKSPGEKLVTLYQVPYQESFGAQSNLTDKENPLIEFYAGFEVRLWIERGILLLEVRGQ